MNKLASHVLALAAKRSINATKPKVNVKKCYGFGKLDIEVVPGQRWYNAWNNILYQMKNNDYTCCEEWLVASRFKEWFDKNYFEGGVLTNLFDPRRAPTHYSPETSVIAPQALAKLVVRSGYALRGSMRGVNIRHRAEHIAYSGIYWDPTRGKHVNRVAPSEIEAHLMWARAHVDRIRKAAETIPNDHTRQKIEEFCQAMEVDIAAKKEIEIFRS